MHMTFLFAAFAVVWLGVLLYVAGLARRTRDLQDEIEDLRSALERNESGQR